MKAIFEGHYCEIFTSLETAFDQIGIFVVFRDNFSQHSLKNFKKSVNNENFAAMLLISFLIVD